MSSSGLLYAIGAAVAWGIVYTIEQRILKGASPFALLFADAVLSVILLLPVLYFQWGSIVSIVNSSSNIWVMILIALALTIAANFFIFSAVKILGASTASVFEIAYPFFVVIFTYVAFQSKPSLYFLLGAVLMFGGAAIIIAFG